MKEVSKVELKLHFDEGFRLSPDATYPELIKDLLHALKNESYDEIKCLVTFSDGSEIDYEEEEDYDDEDEDE